MPASHPDRVVAAIMTFYKKVARRKGYEWARWTRDPKPLTKSGADKFLVSVLLDQQQSADRAWEKGKHLVSKHFRPTDNWWAAVEAASPSDVEAVCRTGFHGKHYAEGFPAGQFHFRLQSMAKLVNADHKGDARNIWKKAEHPDDIYNELVRFDGIGDALAKMGTFILVRNHGAAGGLASRPKVKVKPDEQVRRVMHRSGIAPSSGTSTVVAALDTLALKSPADFDAATWVIGRDFCAPKSPNCAECPLDVSCKHVGLSE